MIGHDKLAEERKRRVIMRAANGSRVVFSWADKKMGHAMITDIGPGPGGIAEVERDLNKALQAEFVKLDAMSEDKQRKLAKALQSSMRNNLDEHGFEGMRVQIDLQPARARLVKVDL